MVPNFAKFSRAFLRIESITPQFMQQIFDDFWRSLIQYIHVITKYIHVNTQMVCVYVKVSVHIQLHPDTYLLHTHKCTKICIIMYLIYLLIHIIHNDRHVQHVYVQSHKFRVPQVNQLSRTWGTMAKGLPPWPPLHRGWKRSKVFCHGVALFFLGGSLRQFFGTCSN